MRPFIIAITIFILLNALLRLGAVFTPLGGSLDFVMGNKLPVKMATLEAYQNKLQKTNQPPVNTLAIGTSVTHNGFASHVFDKTFGNNTRSFNMGIPASNPHLLRTFLEHYVNEYGPPQLLIIEATDTVLSLDNLYMPAIQHLTLINQNFDFLNVMGPDSYLDQKEKEHLALLSACTICHYRAYLSPLVWTNKTIKQRFFPNQASKTASDTHNNFSGYSGPYDQLNEQGWNPTSFPAAMRTSKGKIREAKIVEKRHLSHIKTVDLHQVKNLLDYCQKNNIQAVLVQWPRLPEYMAILKTTPLYNDFQNQLTKLGKQYNAPVIDLEYVSIQSNYPIIFESTYHLEGHSATVYTKALANILKNNLIKTEPSLKESF